MIGRGRPFQRSAEVLLALVTLAVVAGMARLFDGWSWLGPLVANAVLAHLVVALCRRRGLGLGTTGAVMAGAAALVTSWSCYWSTTTAGLPTGGTWSAMRTDLADAWGLYQDVVAPAAPVTGFVFASALSLWCIAYVADWAAFRLHVPFEATLPAGTLFLFTALLGTTDGRGWSVALYAGALVGFLLVHRMSRQEVTTHWVAEQWFAGRRALLTVGVAVGAVAVVAGTVLGPSLPGAASPGLVDPRALRNEDSARVTLNPLVDIRARLIQQSSVEAFQVHSPQPAYWRLTSLERFDGEKWWSTRSYGDAGRDLESAAPTTGSSATFTQEYTIEALGALWLPAAFEPRALEVQDVGVLYDDESSTLVVDRDLASSDGLTYAVASVSPRLEAADLRRGAGPIPDEIAERYLALPKDLSPRVIELARSLTADAATPYDAARALQDHLQTFTYDLAVPRGHSDDVLERFLFDTKRGYCEQFAASYAAMARVVGLPARVAIGFTQGEADPQDPTLYRVRGEHAHAWPEVYLAGAGWVAFEPTPGRGMPFAEGYTGVPAAQAESGNPGAFELAPTTTFRSDPSATLPTTPAGNPSDQLNTEGLDQLPSRDHGGSSVVATVARVLAWAVGGALTLTLLYALAFPAWLLLRRRRRRAGATTPTERVHLAWLEAIEDAGRIGYREVASDTYAERAEALAAVVDDPAARTAARELGLLQEVAIYAPTGADEPMADEADGAAAVLRAAIALQTPWQERARSWLDPRPHVRGFRRRRAQQQRQITTPVRTDVGREPELVGRGS